VSKIAQYYPHLQRQEANLRMFMDDEMLVLDPDIDYHAVQGLSAEVKERLSRVRPTSIFSFLATCVCRWWY
jgi:tRNA uridine 5-carboxymethylaminomethyl modification enzyme